MPQIVNLGKIITPYTAAKICEICEICERLTTTLPQQNNLRNL